MMQGCSCLKLNFDTLEGLAVQCHAPCASAFHKQGTQLPAVQDCEMSDEVMEAAEIIIDALTPANDKEILVCPPFACS